MLHNTLKIIIIVMFDHLFPKQIMVLFNNIYYVKQL